MAQRLGDLLLWAGLITEEQLDKALQEQKKSGGRLGSVIAGLGYLSETDIAQFLGKQFGVKAINLSDVTVEENLIKLLPANLAQKYFAIPVGKKGRILTVVMMNPADIQALEDLRFSTGYEISPAVAPESAILKALDRYYGSVGLLAKVTEDLESAETMTVTEEENEDDATSTDLSEAAAAVDSGPIAKLVNKLLVDAVAKRASDIHIEPYEKELRIRYCIDGVLHEIMNPPFNMRSAISTRVKILSKLNIAEKRRPQDGRIKIKVGEKMIDLRVSVVPTLFGEKVALRILDRTATVFDLVVLGLEEKPLKDFIKSIRTPYGIVLSTGPTGCGKTTTLYAALNLLNSVEVNIITAEDPIEYSLFGINQLQVNEEIGLTFETALRSFLRQDPNIIMVGEIRDKETTEMAIRSSLTGHLVLSTVHTNSAALTLTRLTDMKVEPFLLASSLLLVQSQRLVRRICSNCKEAEKVSPDSLRERGVRPEELEGATVYRGRGCMSCHNTGYRGRVGIMEVLPISPTIRDMVLKRCTAAEIEAEAVKEGMANLRKDGMIKVRKGVTSLDEVLRETLMD
jgi:type IV pilus assembly protein PilB